MSSSIAKAIITSFITILILLTSHLSSSSSLRHEQDPRPTPWPHQFHSILMMNYTGTLEIINLWYDWPNGRNFNIIQHQLGSILYDLEWNNGTSFFYSLDSSKTCTSSQLEVGILRPNWLDEAEYLGQRHVDGFLCNVWNKVDFLLYYEDVVTKRPVHWAFYTGREAHVMTFEVGAVLEDAKWQAPVYCFDQKAENDNKGGEFSITGASVDGLLRGRKNSYNLVPILRVLNCSTVSPPHNGGEVNVIASKQLNGAWIADAVITVSSDVHITNQLVMSLELNCINFVQLA